VFSEGHGESTIRNFELAYQEHLIVLIQRLKKIISKFRDLPLSIEIFHFFYEGPLDFKDLSDHS